jgi:hypothetical protein
MNSNIRHLGTDAAVITAAFVFRNAIVILALTTLALCALAQP